MEKMNIVRISGDACHVLSFALLWHRVKGANVRGISRNTQDLFLLTFILRYVDLAWDWYSIYNTFLKVLYIGWSGIVCVQLRRRVSHAADYESIGRLKLVLFAAIMGCISQQYSRNRVTMPVFETSWEISLWLESVAILPQLTMLQKHGFVENLTSHYIASLGVYRLLYIVNWLYRWRVEKHRTEYVVWTTGVVQTIMYIDFFYIYCITKRDGMQKPMKLDEVDAVV